MNLNEVEQVCLSFFGLQGWDDFPAVHGMLYIDPGVRVRTWDTAEQGTDVPLPSFKVGVSGTDLREDNIPLETVGAFLRNLAKFQSVLDDDVLVRVSNIRVESGVYAMAFLSADVRMGTR